MRSLPLRLLRTAPVLMLLSILMGCELIPHPSMPTTPSVPTVSKAEAKSADLGHAAFCDIASPLIYHGGASNVTVGIIIMAASRTNSTVDDVRLVVGDTKDTISQIYAYDKVGEKLCGWGIAPK